ncbi:MAG: 3'-5' exonuclease [Ignavibacteriales bacterium]|nr:3'-5' exonuclease [Ignavibacteriales bacterium]
MKFLAIDFETANYYPDSACALGFARVENNTIVQKDCYLIRPPTRWFVFSELHGITWDDVKDKPTFGELWNTMKTHFHDVDFVVAHNASFDKRVLAGCCATYRVAMPKVKFKCTVEYSRNILGIKPANLPNVCKELGIPLNHHDAASDTEACAKIMLEVFKRWSN